MQIVPSHRSSWRFSSGLNLISQDDSRATLPCVSRCRLLCASSTYGVQQSPIVHGQLDDIPNRHIFAWVSRRNPFAQRRGGQVEVGPLPSVCSGPWVGCSSMLHLRQTSGRTDTSEISVRPRWWASSEASQCTVSDNW
jgi:hypothetical protein